ncbi:type II toxin-antitoxin system HicA family toxin [Cyanothece sp. BG0011]|uniref:type II toxin-antitoxin system HicA family toxin n=1 Tax=Cyanothece sp. BG0011 TaxID=2082950 RepID=UPI000D1D8D84|nr:type II toxin-antitoxin system HicA family toxin [Cyanothece sp. BG0011]
MSKQDKLLIKILLGNADANIPFEQLCQLLKKLGFDERLRGSHHIFTQEGIEEILNIRPKQGKAKSYQVKQIRNLILKYKLGDKDENSL